VRKNSQNKKKIERELIFEDNHSDDLEDD